jgi:hypothetical protein
MTTHLLPRNMLIGAAIATLLLLPGTAFADAHSEIVNAEQHAGFAAGAAALAEAHAHLHHTLNCLVGPAGNGFAANEINPCAQAGNGAIPDTQDQAKRQALEAAAAKARAGIAATTLNDAKKSAAEAQAMLKKEE